MFNELQYVLAICRSAVSRWWNGTTWSGQCTTSRTADRTH